CSPCRVYSSAIVSVTTSGAETANGPSSSGSSAISPSSPWNPTGPSDQTTVASTGVSMAASSPSTSSTSGSGWIGPPNEVASSPSTCGTSPEDGSFHQSSPPGASPAAGCAALSGSEPRVS